jgi:hypothetical protein
VGREEDYGPLLSSLIDVRDGATGISLVLQIDDVVGGSQTSGINANLKCLKFGSQYTYIHGKYEAPNYYT